MENLTLQIPTQVALALAVNKGWQPTIDDETQEMVEDNYPQIANPQTYQEFLGDYCSQFIIEYVLNEGRQMVKTQFGGTLDAVNDQIDNGTFDELILAGNLDGIREAVKSSL